MIGGIRTQVHSISREKMGAFGISVPFIDGPTPPALRMECQRSTVRAYQRT
jgi:hypothetical protein